MKNRSSNKKSIGVFSLTMLIAVSVDSVRNLPANALSGSALFFFFFLAVIFFLIPSTLISAELSSSVKNQSGVYTWVKEAFGKEIGFVCVWFQWVENIIFFPTILSFIAATILYLISPNLGKNNFLLVPLVLLIFWLITVLNLFGIELSVTLSNICSLFGLVIPMFFILLLGLLWFTSSKQQQIHFSRETFFPQLNCTKSWVSLTGIILSLCGMEVAAVYSEEIKEPKDTYPKAMLLAAFIVSTTLLFGSLSIAIALPVNQINLTSGIIQTFQLFLKAQKLEQALPWIALMLIIGAVGTVNNWVIAPVKSLLMASNESSIFHQSLVKLNKYNVPSRMLLAQGFVVSAVTMIFLIMPTVNSSYWLLTSLSTQLYMVMYILMFCAAIKLKYHGTLQEGGFKIPGGKFGTSIVSIMGIIGSLTSIVVGFFPQQNIKTCNTPEYELILTLGLILISIPPFIPILFKRITLCYNKRCK